MQLTKKVDILNATEIKNIIWIWMYRLDLNKLSQIVPIVDIARPVYVYNVIYITV